MSLQLQSEEEFSTISSSKNNYHFIDLIRYVSIIGITSLHSIYFFGLPQFVSIEEFLRRTDHPLVLIIFLQLMRFSVISFCMISGFLLGKKIRIENSFKLFCKRAKATLPPYIIALLLTALYWCLWAIVKEEESNLFSILINQLLESSFWYIPSNLLSLILILLLLKRLPTLYLGGVLFILLVFVTVKFVYLTSLSHTNPIFFLGFSFYIWLGGMFWKYDLVKYVNRLDIRIVILLWVITFGLGVFETYYHYDTLAFNNLKVSNQLYAVISFITLIRISNHVKPFSKINPRKETYGIYLYSPLIGLIIGVLLHKIVGYFDSDSTLNSIAYTLLHFFTTFIMTTIAVKLMLKYKLMLLSRGEAG